ncbi:MAG: hypothetical protein DRJ01_08665 [Bacteroidetes bacterium]|nr:MAG: hypothetical protein DRJ01_08665 [Bacteroidota bacterium]
MSKIYLSGVSTKTIKTRRAYLITGFILIGIFILITVFEIIKKDFSGVSLCLFSVVYGSVFIFIGLSKNYKKFNKYIEINSQKIKFKNTALKKADIINVDDIKQFEIKPALINCKLENGFYEMNLCWVSYKDIQEIKEKIRAIAKEKNIDIVE